MDLDTILKIAIATAIGLAFVTNLVLYLALRSQKVPVRFLGSAKPGYLENLYHQTPALRSPFLSAVAFFCTLSKILVIIAGIGLVLASGLRK